MLRAKFAHRDLRCASYSPRISWKCCAHLPREERVGPLSVSHRTWPSERGGVAGDYTPMHPRKFGVCFMILCGFFGVQFSRLGDCPPPPRDRFWDEIAPCSILSPAHARMKRNSDHILIPMTYFQQTFKLFLQVLVCLMQYATIVIATIFCGRLGTRTFAGVSLAISVKTFYSKNLQVFAYMYLISQSIPYSFSSLNSLTGPIAKKVYLYRLFLGRFQWNFHSYRCAKFRWKKNKIRHFWAVPYFGNGPLWNIF
jgi:hypothetical protein